ncbi:DUF6268 family outer membrane beta-barrel protein [Marivirga harenae]|uniref:DUF6268 family outer membrane beta-barrel protein n=1 Tax=Marivirga harenae TaxID=2010992 RepID=UPI0026DFA18F|nr:DUF6268 family outer membrane beta-barrel protein [Marivirga harenae]WKV12582.1 DUF6268 family outer membrane beta-barrel protein [Marivirga harenae]
MKHLSLLTVLFFVLSTSFVKAQEEGEEEEIDWDAYGEVEYAGGQTKSYANAKIVGLSPAKFITIGYEQQFPYDFSYSNIEKDAYAFDQDRKEAIDNNLAEEGRIGYTGGLRISANIPVISTNSFIWQMGMNYMQSAYRFQDDIGAEEGGLREQLNGRSLHTTGLFTTLYKPFNETTFMLLQAQADMSGDYSLSDLGDQYLRYSAAALFGKRPHDRLQWALGISRTYRVGAPNYVPIILYNYTSQNRKWGIEALLPARAFYRYSINQTNLLLAGFELEGGSYRIGGLSNPTAGEISSFEIRRGEIKARLEYQRRLVGFFWWSVQAGVRIDYSYDADYLDDGAETLRVFGIAGEAPFSMRNSLGPAPYFNFSISFVSP